MAIGKALRNRLPLISGLGLAFTLPLPPAAGAEGPVRVAEAQENAPAPGPAGAGIEEILVKGAESQVAKDFSAADAVTAFSTADLVALGATSIADLAAFTPNLEIVTTGSTTPTFFIRGVGLNDFGANTESSVAIYQDDVAINSQALALGSLFDMENVAVLRGPQGTGLARNASGGAIKLYSRKPTGQFNGFLRAERGNFNATEYEGAAEAPIFRDMLSGRVAFRFNERDGTVLNRCGGAPPLELRTPVPKVVPLRAMGKLNTDPPWSICGEPVVFLGSDPPAQQYKSHMTAGLPNWVNDRNNWAARGTLLFEPTLDTSWLLGIHGGRRNELSRLGKSFGTNDTYCLNGDRTLITSGPKKGLTNCDLDFGDPRGNPIGSRIRGLLGGTQGVVPGYQAPEVRQRWTELAPCFNNGFSLCRTEAQLAQLDLAKRTTADELARTLGRTPWEGDYNHVGRTTNNTAGGYVKGTINLPAELEFTTLSGYEHYDRKIDLGLDFSPETLFHVDQMDHGYQYTEDMKLAGETELVRDAPIHWDIGGWYLHDRIDVKIANDLGDFTRFGVGRREYSQKIDSLAGYGSFSSDFWDDFTLDGGVRWNYEDKRIPNYLLFQDILVTPLKAHDIWQEPTGTIRLTYRFREDTHAYWKYTHGWKPGHYNATGSRLAGITTAQPETIDAFETGLHAWWFGGFLSGDAQLFYYDYKNYQIFTAQQFSGGGPEFVVVNANRAEVYGAEIQAIARPWAGALLNVNFSWLETQFLDFVQIQQEDIIGPTGKITINRELDNTGHPLLNSPEYKVSITASQLIPLRRYGSLEPRYDGAWTDNTYFDATKGRGLPNIQNVPYAPKLAFGQKAYWLHNFRLAYRTPDGRLEIAGWVRNIENKAYKQFAFDGSTFQATTIYFVGDPRTFGGTVTVAF